MFYTGRYLNYKYFLLIFDAPFHSTLQTCLLKTTKRTPTLPT